MTPPVFPVFVTGLHCGHGDPELKARVLALVFPVFVTGLHCGEVEAAQHAGEPETSSRSS